MAGAATALIVLAAGRGTRMASDRPKVLHPLGGAPLLAHALAAGATLQPTQTVVITGHSADAVEAACAKLAPDAACVRQDEQLGTGHAVAQAAPALEGFAGDALVLFGDTPFIAPETLARLRTARAAGADVVVLGFEAADPGRYGRLVMEGDRLTRIVEFKDASEAERAIRLCNSGVLIGRSDLLFELIASLRNDNAAGEYYLTDVVGLANQRGLRCGAVICDEAETLGINTRAELAAAEAVFQTRRRAEALAGGTTMIAPETVYFSLDTVIGRDTLVEPHVYFGPKVRIADRVTIRAFCHLEGASIGPDSVIGPFARLRPGTELATDVRVGNFVEVKNAALADGVRAGHLSYLGDAAVGARTNVGAGTVTCNYDGVSKHRTEIGSDVFIGSSTMLVAPLRLGDRVVTGSGSVLTEDVEAEALALERARQVVKPGRGAALMARLRRLAGKE